MEKKTKHRILGIMVVLGLVIIMLPLFQSGGELPPETKIVKAPPFPDQSVQVTTPSVQVAEEQAVIPVPSPQQSAESEMNQGPNDVMGVARPSVVNEIKTPADSDNQAKVAELEPVMSPDEDDFKTQMTSNKTEDKANPVPAAQVSNDVLTDVIPAKKSVQPRAVKSVKLVQAANKNLQVTKQARVSKTRPMPYTNTPIRDNGLLELKNAAWVIQIGSFKNKANALRLVNQLRAGGYRAFIQQTSSNFGDSTRVFVGPENKRNSARALADRLESDMHIRGIVISYKPLTL